MPTHDSPAKKRESVNKDRDAKRKRDEDLEKRMDDVRADLFEEKIDAIPNEQHYELTFDDETTSKLSKKPYLKRLGDDMEDDEAFHDDESKMIKLIAKVIHQKKTLSRDLINEARNNVLKSEQLLSL